MKQPLNAVAMARVDDQIAFALADEKQKRDAWRKHPYTLTFLQDLKDFKENLERQSKVAALRGDVQQSAIQTIQASVIEKVINYGATGKFEFGE